MSSIKSSQSNSVINIEYEDFTNNVVIAIGNKTGFRFVNLTFEQCELINEYLNDAKNQIV